MKNEFKTIYPSSLFTLTNWEHTDLTTFYAGDIRHPWKSVYGLPTTIARLAANQKLILHCREDEVFNLLTTLNDLLANPESLNQAYMLLKTLEKATHQELLRLIELQQPLAKSEIPGLLEQVEQILIKPSPQTVAGRLEIVLSPNQPVKKIAGVSTMLARLQILILALNKVKDQGFRVVVRNKRRQPARPTLEARRNEPIRPEGQQSTLTAGFLLPAKYHLTLWAYLLVRSDNGQSTVWN